MDPLRLCLAFGPLALYLFVIGAINLSRRPLLVTGARDLAALGVGVSGLILVGPIELLLPERAAVHFGWYVWPLVGTMYALGLSLAVLLARPRLVIYNISMTEVRPVLAEAIEALDPLARWVGNSLVLPKLHVELYLESASPMRNVSLVASGDEQSYAGWRVLEAALAARLKKIERSPSPWGLGWVSVALVMLGRMGWDLVTNTQSITQAFFEMMRLQ